MYEVIIEKKFSSAHFLRNYHGHDEPIHGHNWRVEVRFAGGNLVQPEEYLVDFAEAHAVLDKIIAKVDYKNLNDAPPFNKRNPSAENIARWIYDEAAAALPAPKPSRVTVWETDEGAASFVPDS